MGWSWNKHSKKYIKQFIKIIGKKETNHNYKGSHV